MGFKDLHKVKIILFDTAQKLEAHNLTPVDSYKGKDGIWHRKTLAEEDINKIIDSIKYGLKENKLSVDDLHTKEETMEEDATVIAPMAIETDSVIGMSVEALVHEAEVQEKADEIRSLFINYTLGWVEDKSFAKALKRLEKEGFTKKKIKAAVKASESDNGEGLSSALLDIKFFNTDPEVAVADNDCDAKDFAYAGEFVDFQKLNVEDSVWDLEDMDNDILAKRVPGGMPVETESKFGLMVEKMIAKVAYAPHNKLIRDACTKYAVGMIDLKTFKKAVKVAECPAPMFARIVKECDKAIIFSAFNRVVIDKVEADVACKYDECTDADWQYVTAIIDPTTVKKKTLIFADSLDPMEDDD